MNSGWWEKSASIVTTHCPRALARPAFSACPYPGSSKCTTRPPARTTRSPAASSFGGATTTSTLGPTTEANTEETRGRRRPRLCSPFQTGITTDSSIEVAGDSLIGLHGAPRAGGLYPTLRSVHVEALLPSGLPLQEALPPSDGSVAHMIRLDTVT